jgi:hypothetical protein
LPNGQTQYLVCQTKNDCFAEIVRFDIEKGSRPADVLSVVTDKSATTSTISISESAEKYKLSDENSSKILERHERLTKNC